MIDKNTLFDERRIKNLPLYVKKNLAENRLGRTFIDYKPDVDFLNGD
jgi:hypothetical protein